MFEDREKILLAHSEEFQELLASDEVLKDLRRMKTDRKAECLILASIARGCAQWISGSRASGVLTPALWSFLWTLGNAYTEDLEKQGLLVLKEIKPFEPFELVRRDRKKMRTQTVFFAIFKNFLYIFVFVSAERQTERRLLFRVDRLKEKHTVFDRVFHLKIISPHENTAQRKVA